MSQTFFAILTAIGEAKLANATALGTTVQLTQMAVGDGNGAPVVPIRTQTTLVNERRRALINTLFIDPANASQIVSEQVIPEDIGGWWIREIGLFDIAGDLIAVANCPDTYKPVLAEGSGRTQVIRMVLIVANASSVQLKVDPAIVLATRAYADGKVLEHEQKADPHAQYLTAAEGNAAIAAAVAALVNSSPTTLDTLAELATALGNDANFAATLTNLLALKAPLASPALTGNPSAPTPAQFDNDTSLATTEFVQRALGNMSGAVANSTAALALTAAHAGKAINCYNTPQTLALPAASSVPAGTTFTIFNSVDVTLNVAGADLIYTGGVSQSSIVIRAGDGLTLVQFTNSQWLAIGGAAPLKNASAFGSSLAANGYQKLPSGLIIQWGSVTIAANNVPTDQTLPVAFSSAGLQIVVTSSGSGTASANYGAEFLSSSVARFTSNHTGAVGARWIAVGY